MAKTKIKSKKKKLSPMRQRFVDEYPIDLNATQAAIRAGYSAKRADAIGYDLLRISEIREAIDKALAERSERTKVTQDIIIKELARIAFIDPRKISKWKGQNVTLHDSDGLTEDEAAAVAEVSEIRGEFGSSIKVKTYDKLKALELLGKHLGMYIDKKEITGEGGGPCAIKWADE